MKRKNVNLTPQQTADLINQYRNTGDKKALDMVVKTYYEYAVKLAVQHVSDAFDLTELIEEALTGLVEAIEHYDTASGARFTTCAYFWIQKRLLAFISKFSTSFSRKEADDDEELVLDMDATYMAGHEVYVKQPTTPFVDSLSRVIADDGYDTYTLEETIGVEDTTIDDDFRRMECRKALEDGLKQLSKREALIFRLCNGIGCKKQNYATIAKMFNIKSPERVCQINGSIMRKLAIIIDPSILN